MRSITAVHLEHHRGHGHIAAVRLGDGTTQQRSEVIFNIRIRKQSYRTLAPGQPPALVTVGRCPHCGSRDYLTTVPDWSRANNLLNLPKF
jgi:Protein of unknown function (DUF3892)